MSETIRVISGDLDGADLRRDINKNSYYTRCDGKGDNEQIQEAINHVGKFLVSIPSEKWNRIFGDK